MEKLDVKKIYIDTRYKAKDSKSDSNFMIDLPRNINLPEDTIAFIDDMVIPCSWSTVNENNSKLYFDVRFDGTWYFFSAEMEHKNYNGTTFAAELQTKMNAKIEELYDPDPIVFNVTYQTVDNKITISYTDIRTIKTTTMTVHLYSDDELLEGVWSGNVITNPKSINDHIRLTTSFSIVTAFPFDTTPIINYEAHLNLHPIRNLYLLSSSLSSYDTISNFGIDTIVKKIPIRANYNEIIFDNANEGFDFIKLPKRMIQRLDFKLVDSHNNDINLRNNHISFSIVFQRTN